MDEDIKSWCYDILNSIEEIESYFTDADRNFSSYKSNTVVKRAVERNLEIIGEAMNRIMKRDSSLNFPDSRKIIDTRNRIIHSYDNVSDDIIWSIVINHLPKLKSEIQTLL